MITVFVGDDYWLDLYGLGLMSILIYACRSNNLEKEWNKKAKVFATCCTHLPEMVASSNLSHPSNEQELGQRQGEQKLRLNQEKRTLF